MRYLSLFVFVICLCSCASQRKSKPITKFSQKDVKNGILVDVRTLKEFNSGHLENAVHIDWFDPDFADRFDTIPKQRKIYLYCKRGKRSAKAQNLLDSLGYTHVMNLKGGYEQWSVKN